MKNKLIFTETSVIKQFHSKIAYNNEKHILSLLADTDLCPSVIDDTDSCLEISIIDGVTLSDAIDEKLNLFHIFEKLVQWVEKFNSLTKAICLDDINLKNFIYSQKKDKIYGIDFECWRYGDNTLNFAAVTAMISTANFEDKNLQVELYNHIKHYIISACGINVSTNESDFVDKVSSRRKAMPYIKKSDCVVIAGGKSSRMGSPKGLLDLDGFTFTDHIIYNTSVFDKQYISANSNLYDSFSCEIIRDNYAGIGPMGALQACLTKCEKEYVFFIPCDMPFISEETIFYLYNQLKNDADAAVFKTEDKVFPTVGVYKKSVLSQIEAQIATGNYKMMELLNRINTQYICPILTNQFKNINTPQDYKNI